MTPAIVGVHEPAAAQAISRATQARTAQAAPCLFCGQCRPPRSGISFIAAANAAWSEDKGNYSALRDDVTAPQFSK
jgi:hypothetical protein